MGLIEDLDPSLIDRIISLRKGRSWGPDRIHRELADELPANITPRVISNWIYKSGVVGQPVSDRLGAVAELLERSGIDPANIGKVKSVRLSEWQGVTKNAEGEAETHDLKGSSIVLSPEWAEGPKWPVVQPAKPCVVRPAGKRTDTKAQSKRTATRRTAVVLPDVQVGFRRDQDTGELDPFHDEAAIAAALAVVKAIRPDRVILVGDLLDFAEFSRFQQEPAFAGTTQATIDRAHLLLAEVRANAPEATIDLMEGNHDRRLQTNVINNAKAAFGLRQGATPPESWPVLSVPHLLRLDDLGARYISGYPANITWVNERLAVIHGHIVRSAGSTAAAVVDDERVSVLFGHVHRLELQHRTRRTYHGARFALAASLGCLCRIDGAVPSTKGSTDVFGRAVPTVEDWQHACGVVTYEDGDKPFALELVPIFNGQAFFRGQTLGAAA